MDATAATSKLNDLYAKLVGRRHDIDTLDNYYEGKQPLAFASREWAEFHKDRYVGFSDNWCGVVADAVSERVRVTGVRVGDERTDAERGLWDDWQRNEMDAQSSQGFLESIVATRSAVLVWGDKNDNPVMTWEHPSQVYVEYAADNARSRTAAIKAWVDDSTEYATLYTPDEVWKFQRATARTSGLILPAGYGATDWQPRQPDGDDSWPLPNPLGEVPIVEVQNRPRLGREPMSDIQGARAMQDAVNLLWAFLFAAADHASMPGRVIMGQEPPKLPILDENGQKIGEKAVDIKDLQHGRFLWLTGQNTKIAEFTAAKLDVFTQVIEIGVGHLGAQTRTPAHYFIANKGLSNVNGETLTATETPLVKKAEEFALFSSGSIRDIFRLSALVRNGKALADSITASSILWKNAGIRSESQLADALSKKKQIGYPFEYLLELDGVGPNDRDRIMAMVKAEQEDPYLSMMGAKSDAETPALG